MVVVIDRISEKDLLVGPAQGFLDSAPDVTDGKIAGTGGQQEAVEAEPGRQAETGRSEVNGGTCLHKRRRHHHHR